MVLDADGYPLQILDYQPYGAENMNEQSASYATTYTFTGKERDPETGYTYFGARYYSDTYARFTSQDPVVLAMGTPALQDKTQQELPEFLSDPQALNSYAYARNNPVVYLDETGDFFVSYLINRYITRKALDYAQESPREAISLGVGFTPVVGDVYDAASAITGRDYISGENLGTAERVLSGVGVLPIPYVTGGALRVGKEGVEEGIKNSQKIFTDSLKTTRIVRGLDIDSRAIKSIDDITGFTEHGLNQIISRGVKPEHIKDTIANPIKVVERIDKLGRISFRYIGEKAVINFNEAKEIITGWLK